MSAPLNIQNCLFLLSVYLFLVFNLKFILLYFSFPLISQPYCDIQTFNLFITTLFQETLLKQPAYWPTRRSGREPLFGNKTNKRNYTRQTKIKIFLQISFSQARNNLKTRLLIHIVAEKSSRFFIVSLLPHLTAIVSGSTLRISV